MKKTVKIIGICGVLAIGLLLSIYYYQRTIAKENKKPWIVKEKIDRGIVEKEVAEEIWRCLYYPKEMALFSIDPEMKSEEIRKSKEGSLFHDYIVLGSTNIINRNDQYKIAEDIKNAVNSSHGAFLCFDPRHGVRVSDGKVVYDFLICFECGEMKVYSSDGSVESVMIGGSKDVLNEILIKAKVPLPISGN
jgi:hypothetical protein